MEPWLLLWPVVLQAQLPWNRKCPPCQWGIRTCCGLTLASVELCFQGTGDFGGLLETLIGAVHADA